MSQQAEAVTPVTYACEKCGKTFYTRKALAIHRVKAHSDGSNGHDGRLRIIVAKMPESYYEWLKELSTLRKEPVSQLIRRAVSELLLRELAAIPKRRGEE